VPSTAEHEGNRSRRGTWRDHRRWLAGRDGDVESGGRAGRV